jgi:hypothetical protein
MRHILVTQNAVSDLLMVKITTWLFSVDHSLTIGDMEEHVS